MEKTKLDFNLKELDAPSLNVLTSVETREFLENNPYAVRPAFFRGEEISRKFGKAKKTEPFNNEDLPESFKNRTFIKNLSSLTYKLEELPGHIVKFDKKKNDYKIVSVKRFVSGDLAPELTIIEDGMLYCSKINSGASFNGSFLIGGLKVDNKSIMELIVQDVVFSVVPDEMVLKSEIKQIADSIDLEERDDYHFIKGTTLTLVNNKTYREQKFESKINNTYVTAGGKVFASNEKFTRERLVSLDLIALGEML